MSEIALAKINTFGTLPKADFVPPSEDPAFILTSSQLSALITKAVEKAISTLQNEVATLREERDQDREELAAVRQQIAASEQWQATLSDNQYTQLKLIHSLREESQMATGPSQRELERVARIEKLCTDAPGHIISLPELRGRLSIDKAVLSRLLKRINQDKFYLRQSKTDKRIRYLCLRHEVR
jgi:chromosome segregation ATPase